MIQQRVGWDWLRCVPRVAADAYAAETYLPGGQAPAIGSVLRLPKLAATLRKIAEDGAKAYVALGPANRVAVVDTATWEVRDYLLVGQRVWQLAFSPDGKFLYTTNGNSNDISIIDTATDEVVKSVQVGEQPWGVVAVE